MATALPRVDDEAPAYQPYVSAAQQPAELTIRSLISSGLIAGGSIAGIAVAALAAMFAKQAEAVQVPAADYVAHLAGLQQMVGPIAESDPFALLIFVGLGAVLYRVANR